VKVYVGPTREHYWTLPEDLLCDKLEFFRAAFKGPFKEGEDKEIHLEDDDPAVFEKLIDWLCTSGGSNNLIICPCEDTGPTCFSNQMALFKFYELADKVGEADLVREVLSTHKICNKWEGDGEETIKVINIADALGHGRFQLNMIEDAVAHFMNEKKTLDNWAVIIKHNAAFHLQLMAAIRKHNTLRLNQFNVDYCTVHGTGEFVDPDE